MWLVPKLTPARWRAPGLVLRDKHGQLVRDYNTPASTDDPGVLDFLGTVHDLRGWGFEYYKFDGEHALPHYVPRVEW